MPREHVYGARATVTYGEPSDVGSRLVAYRAFVTGVRGVLNTYVSDAGTAGPLRRDLEAQLSRLDDSLFQLNAAQAATDEATTDDTDASPDGDRDVVLRATVGWTRNDGVVTLGVTAVDADTRAEVPLPGSPHVTLDWPAANQLLRALRTGRDGSCGAPQ